MEIVEPRICIFRDVTRKVLTENYFDRCANFVLVLRLFPTIAKQVISKVSKLYETRPRMVIFALEAREKKETKGSF